jgi:hypothetical protein
MARKVSISERLKAHSNKISFKNKRRKIVQPMKCSSRPSNVNINNNTTTTTTTTESTATLSSQNNKRVKSEDWRKSHESESCDIYDDDENETKSQIFQRQFFQQNFSSPHNDERHVDFMSEKKNNNVSETTVNTSNNGFNQSSQKRNDLNCHIKHTPAQRRQLKRRVFVNCQNLLNWANQSSVKKLMPIFILINMLPFLYAGEFLELYCIFL